MHGPHLRGSMREPIDLFKPKKLGISQKPGWLGGATVQCMGIFRVFACFEIAIKLWEKEQRG